MTKMEQLLAQKEAVVTDAKKKGREGGHEGTAQVGKRKTTNTKNRTRSGKGCLKDNKGSGKVGEGCYRGTY
jgi:hypothetical protein